jgi:hypothetical protein
LNEICSDSFLEASFVDVPDMQEDQIIHDAAKVLRGSLHAVEISKYSKRFQKGHGAKCLRIF